MNTKTINLSLIILLFVFYHSSAYSYPLITTATMEDAWAQCNVHVTVDHIEVPPRVCVLGAYGDICDAPGVGGPCHIGFRGAAVCDEGYTYNPDTRHCEIAPDCTLGTVMQFRGTSGGQPDILCNQKCEYRPIGVGITTVGDGAWLTKGIMTGNSCTVDVGTASPSTPSTPAGCIIKDGKTLCGAATEASNCGTYNGINVCTGAQDGEGYLNGEYYDSNAEKNCGYFNGQYVCVQQKDQNNNGPQNSTPDGEFKDDTGKTTPVNDQKKTQTQTQTVTNPDGSVTVTKTVTSNVKGEGTVTTTTTTQTDGTVTTTTSKSGDDPSSNGSDKPVNESYTGPSGDDLPGKYDQKMNETGIDQIQDGQETYGDDLNTGPGIDNPFDGVTSENACIQIEIGYRGHYIQIPNTVACNGMHVLQKIFEYLVYLITVIAVYQIATRKL